MSEAYPSTAIDKLSVELHEMAKRYAEHAEGQASDPYFREAVVKVAVSNFAWALYHAFDGDDHCLAALRLEMIEQSAAIDRAVQSVPVEGQAL